MFSVFKLLLKTQRIIRLSILLSKPNIVIPACPESVPKYKTIPDASAIGGIAGMTVWVIWVINSRSDSPNPTIYPQFWDFNGDSSEFSTLAPLDITASYDECIMIILLLYYICSII